MTIDTSCMYYILKNKKFKNCESIHLTNDEKEDRCVFNKRKHILSEIFIFPDNHKILSPKEKSYEKTYSTTIDTDGYQIRCRLNWRTKTSKIHTSIIRPKIYETIEELPCDYKNKKLISIDPGHANIISYIKHATVPKKIASTRKQTISKYKKELQLNQESGALSNKEWFYMTGHTYQRTELLKLRNGMKLDDIIQKLKIYKTCNLENFQIYIQEKTLNWNKWWEFAFNLKVRSLRFKVFNQKKLAFAKIARNLSGEKTLNGKTDVLLLWGNGGFGPTSKGHDSAPNKSFRKELSKWIPIVMVDEYKTSKITPCCHKEVKDSYSKLFLRSKIIKKWKKEECGKDKLDTWQKRNMVARGIKHCSCGSTWNRDTMACLNIHFIFNKYVLTNKMPHPFTRKTEKYEFF